MVMQAICTHKKLTDKMFPLPKGRRLILPLDYASDVVSPCVENYLVLLLLKQTLDHTVSLSINIFCMFTVYCRG